jgi:glycyl-tRNA synthetase beta chain
VGAEEIPASFIEPALEELSTFISERAAGARLVLGRVQTFGTPRRLALLAQAVADKSEDLVKEVLGPPVRAAFSADGKPTRAAEKFAESVGRPIDALERAQTPKGEYLAAKVEEKGKPAAEILRTILGEAVHSLHFRKSMRWGDVEQNFARPVHWVVALLGQEVLPLVLGDVRSGRVTFGHRFLAPGPLELADPSGYVEVLRKAHVLVDIPERRRVLLERVQAAVRATGGALLEDEALLAQVTQLVELPCPVVGSFEERHLDLPPEVLVQEMKSHQRYFSVVDSHGKLLPRFVAVSNTPVKDEAVSRRGYERVLRARLADGRFFFDEDRKTPLEARVEKLARVVWQGKLGSYAEKVERFRLLAVYLARAVGKEALIPSVERAATLAKADLVTGMVGEFPELQGVMGREYARATETPEVALAIDEHYLPRGANDRLPTKDVGALVGLADRLDSLCGLFAIGKEPTGAADPFGLRRACLGFIHIVLGRGYRFDLRQAVEESMRRYGSKIPAGGAGAAEKVLEFFRGRLKALWGERQRSDVVEAVLEVTFRTGGSDAKVDLVAAGRKVEALGQVVSQPGFVPLAVAFKRVVNIVQKQASDVAAGPVDPALLLESAEKALLQQLQGVQEQVEEQLESDDYVGALARITSLKEPVDRFFDSVMVMADDRALRANRVRLLTQIRGLFDQVADFSRVQVEA